jgi:hypothetical protein
MSMPGLAPEPESGQPRFPRYFGACEQRPIDQLTSHCSSWCMGQRPFYPLNYSTGPPGSKPINQLRSSKHDRTSATFSKNQGISPSPGQSGINKCFDGTTHEGSTPGFSM